MGHHFQLTAKADARISLSRVQRSSDRSKGSNFEFFFLRRDVSGAPTLNGYRPSRNHYAIRGFGGPARCHPRQHRDFDMNQSAH